MGGGNTAIDCARAAGKLGGSVEIVYRRTRKEMPAFKEEIEEAEKENIRFNFLANPLSVTEKSMKLQKMKLGEPDASGAVGLSP